MALALALILIVIGTVAFHVASPWWLTPLASNWQQMDDALMLMLYITAAIFVVINLFVAYVVLKFRLRDGVRASRDSHNRQLEWWLIGVTSLGIAVMLAPVLAVLGGLYHWFPKMSGRMYSEAPGKLHFWVAFIGAYAIFFPMHCLGILGMPRRYYAYENYSFIPPSAQTMNEFITVAAIIVGVTQLVFVLNFICSMLRGRSAGGNPWRAASLEWFTPQSPPVHGNWGAELPVVYRGAYGYGHPGADTDYLPQTTGPDEGDGHAAPAGRAPGLNEGKSA